jgi:hypothetical protein
MTALEMRAIARRDLKNDIRAKVLLDQVMDYAEIYDLPIVPLFKQLLKVVIELGGDKAPPDKLEELIIDVMTNVLKKAREKANAAKSQIITTV